MISKIRLIVLIILSIILSIGFISGIVSAGDGNSIQAGINANTGGVYVLPAGTYTVSEQIVIPANTELRGEVSQSGELLSKIVLGSGFCLAQQEPIIRLNSNCNVSYIDFNGNSENRDAVPVWHGHDGKGAAKKWGQGYDNFLGCTNVISVRVHHCNFYNNLGDSFRIFTSKNIEFDHNTASKGGHDVFFAVRSEGVKVHDNYIQPRINSAVRLMDVNHARIYSNNIVYVPTYDGKKYDAGPSIQIQTDKGVMQDIEVCSNFIYDAFGPGLWLVGKTSGNQKLWLHHNLFMRSGANHGIMWVGGIIASGYDGALVENNVFDGSYLGAINFYAVNSGWAKSASAELKNNILCNSVPGKYGGKGGYGVYNSIDGQTVKSFQDCFWNNAGGDVSGSITSTSSIFSNPKEVATPSGWTWDGAKWVCPAVQPSEMGAPNGVYDGAGVPSEEELREFEFTNIFDVLNMDFVGQADPNATIFLDGVEYTPSTNVSDASGTIEYHRLGHMSYTLVYVPTEGLRSIQYEVNGAKSEHTLMIGEKSGSNVAYTSVSVWSNASRQGDALKLPGIVDAKDIKITCHTPKGSFAPKMQVVDVEQSVRAFDPGVILYLGFIFIMCSVVFFVILVVFSRH